MKKILFLFELILMGMVLLGCNNVNTPDEVWNAVNDKVFSCYTLDVGIGTGLYFYEKGESKHCLFMVHGSGLYIVGYIDYKISIGEKGLFSVINASGAEIEDFSDPSMDEDFVFQYTRKGIQFGKGLFEYDVYGESSGAYDQIQEVIDQIP